MLERKKNRLSDYDYSNDNLYFVTSVIKDRICYFGDIIDEKIELNKYGKIAEQQWEWLINRYPYIKSHAFIIMPNHIHGILEIDRDFIFKTETGLDLSLQEIKIKSLSELMGTYKTTTSKKIRLAGNNDFAWQRSFYDHIIRDDTSYQNIILYIQNNPINWSKDPLNSIFENAVNELESN